MQGSQLYLKAVTLRQLKELDKIKHDLDHNMIIILRVTPLAQKDIEELRKAVEELYSHVRSLGGDIARLGEERVVLTPPQVKIWRDQLNLN